MVTAFLIFVVLLVFTGLVEHLDPDVNKDSWENRCTLCFMYPVLVLGLFYTIYVVNR